MKREQSPTSADDAHFGVRSEHPAYGSLVLTRRHGGKQVMFGSELRHNETMCITLHQAVHYRGLSNDRISANNIIAEVELTLSQWAQFVASQGMGAGTACTLQYHRDGPLVNVPAIAPPENHLRKFEREMKEAVDERLSAISAHLADLAQMVEEGRGKKDLREAIKEARRHAEQLPGSVAFVNDQFAESIETITEQAKTEVEGFVLGVALRTGILALKTAAPAITFGSEKAALHAKPEDGAAHDGGENVTAR